MFRSRVTVPLVLSATFLFAGCGASTNVEIIDLDKVLDIFAATLTELDGGDSDSVDATAIATADGAGDSQAEPATTAVAAEPDPAKEKQFIAAFRTKLNAAKLMSQPIGVQVAESGEILGFLDADGNNVRAAGDKNLFKIQVDAERNRVIASDMSGRNRDYRYRPHVGFFSGYMIGSMFRNQNRYYSGARSGLRPRFGSMSMSPKGYHTSAVAKARSAARASASRTSSARSRTGSRSFSFGK